MKDKMTEDLENYNKFLLFALNLILLIVDLTDLTIEIIFF